MANMHEIDRLSTLPDELLLTIISFLPTHTAACTSVLCRRFQHLWKACPTVSLVSTDFLHPQYKKFVLMAKHALLDRNASYPLLSLHLDVSLYYQNASFLSSLLVKARSLDLRHLTLEGFNEACFYDSNFLAIPHVIFTINSLRCLSFAYLPPRENFRFKFPSGTTLTCLRSLSLTLNKTDPAKLNQLISEFCSLEDLHLYICSMPGLSLSSRTVKNLKLNFHFNHKKFDNLVLSLPSLESLYLKTQYGVQEFMSLIHVKVPLLRKAVIKFNNLYEEDVSVVAQLFKTLSHVKELSLHINENKYGECTIPIFPKLGKDVPHFSNLKHLDLTLRFHERNIEAVAMMLHNCPVLESLKLVHEIPKLFCLGRERKRKVWESKLPCNADGNYCYAYFRNLHSKEDRKKIMKLLSKKCSSMNRIYRPAK